MAILRGSVLVVGALVLSSCGPPVPPLPAGSNAQSEAPSASAAPEHAGHHGHHGHHGHNGEVPAGQGHQPPTVSHRFDDVEHWVRVFDDPKRDEWQRPDDVVRELDLAPSDRVADLGAGTGYFIGRLARAVPDGRVIAIDVEPKLVAHIRERAERAGAKNVQAVLAEADDPHLPSGVRVVLVVDTYHHIGDRSAYFGRMRDKLAAGGRVVIVDFKKGKLPIGPPDEHKLAPDVVEKEMGAAGYRQCKSYDGLPYQYLLVFAEKC